MSLSIFICILKAYTSIFLVFVIQLFNETRVDYHYDNNDLCRNFIHFMLQFNQSIGISICLHVNMLLAYPKNVMFVQRELQTGEMKINFHHNIFHFTSTFM